MLYCVSVGTSRSVAVDEVNGFVYFGHNGGNITQVTFEGSSTKVIISIGKLNLPNCSPVVVGYDIILHTILLLIHDPCSLLIVKFIYFIKMSMQSLKKFLLCLSL